MNIALGTLLTSDGLTISIGEVTRLTEWLCAMNLLIQTAEFWVLRSHQQEPGVWLWRLQRSDFTGMPGWLLRALDFLYAPNIHEWHLAIRALLAASLFYQTNPLTIILLFTSTVTLLVRWRGTFNGGSDFMTIVVLTGLVISSLGAMVLPPDLAARAGLWYVSIHTLTSYFISGAIKLLHANWRNGRALTYFLDSAAHGPLQPGAESGTQAAGATLSKTVSPARKRFFSWQNPFLASSASWMFIIWECSAPLALWSVTFAAVFCLVALVFHFLVFWYFSLNRFFWAWLSAFPAIIYCASDLNLSALQ
jgi:hypothetical protein